MHKISRSHGASVHDLIAMHEPKETARSPRWQAVLTWLYLALHPATVRRALFTAALVGMVLIIINHGDAILRGELDRTRIAQMLLTLAVPYVVSTVSSVSTRLELGNNRARD